MGLDVVRLVISELAATQRGAAVWRIVSQCWKDKHVGVFSFATFLGVF